ncbi:solute carrier family 40 member 1-like [Argonauta hians]
MMSEDDEGDIVFTTVSSVPTTSTTDTTATTPVDAEGNIVFTNVPSDTTTSTTDNIATTPQDDGSSIVFTNVPSNTTTSTIATIATTPVDDGGNVDGRNIVSTSVSLETLAETTSSTANILATTPTTPVGGGALHWYRRAKTCFSSLSFLVYLSHTLSCWSDRLWSFSVGLFLIQIAPDSLQLTAIYGLISGSMVFFLGAIIGNWVDKTERLKTVKISLFINNASIITCAIIVSVHLYWKTEISEQWNGAADVLVKIGIIGFAVIAKLASLAGNISVKNDWVVEISERDPSKLAYMTAALRRIDLAVKLLAPVLAGQIMTYISVLAGSSLIASWNFVSVFVEYYLLYRVFQSVPSLATKKSKDDDKQEAESLNESERQPPNAFCSRIFTLFNGWRVYLKYDVAPAGFGMALLYMTALGFDNITVGFAYSQGLTESILGILMAAGALIGISATFVYPRIRNKIGLPRTGLISFSLEIFCLTACLMSIIAPGNPYKFVKYPTLRPTPESIVASLNDSSLVNVSEIVSSSPSMVSTTETNLTVTTEAGDRTHELTSYVSIGLLMGGIITARFGLWSADLTVTQLFMENIDESERGVVNGVQNSLNMLMDMLKFLLVILIPHTSDFYILIIISYIFICLGGISFSRYSLRKRGHLFHFNKINACLHKHTQPDVLPSNNFPEERINVVSPGLEGIPLQSDPHSPQKETSKILQSDEVTEF